MAARRHHVDEGLSGEAALEQRLQIDALVGESRVERRVDAADHRRQMRREHDGHGRFRATAESLHDLRMMAVAADAVRLEVVRGLGEHQPQLALASGAGHAGFGVGDELRGVDHTGFDKRQEAQLDRRRIAARIAHDARLGDRCAVHLGQTIRGFGEKVRARVWHLVPPLEFLGILEPEIRRQVDDLYTRIDQLARLSHGDAVRRGEENDVAGAQVGFGWIAVAELANRALPAQAGEHVAH